MFPHWLRDFVNRPGWHIDAIIFIVMWGVIVVVGWGIHTTCIVAITWLAELHL